MAAPVHGPRIWTSGDLGYPPRSVAVIEATYWGGSVVPRTRQKNKTNKGMIRTKNLVNVQKFVRLMSCYRSVLEGVRIGHPERRTRVR